MVYDCYDAFYSATHKIAIFFLFLPTIYNPFRLKRHHISKYGQEYNKHYNHGTYIKWYLINRCACKAQYMLFDLIKAFD